MGSEFTSEQEMGPPILEWLRARGFDVYQEVTLGGARADIVAVAEKRPRLVVVVEMKLSFSLDVIAQAWGWSKQAHLVYAAVPRARRAWATRGFAYKVAGDYGVGVLELVKRPGYGSAPGGADITERVSPTLRRRIDPELAARLRPEHKTYAKAGTNSGGHWTPFKDTAWRLLEVVSRHPDGIPLRQALRDIGTHHYGSDASARACLSRLALQGVIDGMEAVYEGKTLLLKPKPPQPIVLKSKTPK